MKYLSFTFLLFFASFTAFAQKNVIPLPADSGAATANNYFYYALPKTAFKIDVVVNKITQMKGYYNDYAEKLLGLTNIIKQNKTYYQLQNVNIQPITLPDENYQYAVELTKNQIKHNYLAQIYTHRDTSRQIPFATSFTQQNSTIPDFFRYYSDLSYVEESNNYVETQIVDGVVRQVPASTTKKVTKTNDQKANEAADYIAKIRNDRYNLLIGSQEVPYSKEAIEILVNQLDELEKNYIQLFTGFTINDELHYSFIVSPLDTSDLNMPIFSISEKTGFSTCTSSNKDTENYYLSLKPQFSNQKWSEFADQRKNLKKPNRNNGYRTRQPIPTYISLNQGKKELFAVGIFDIYQFGKIEILPANQTIDISKYILIF